MRSAAASSHGAPDWFCSCCCLVCCALWLPAHPPDRGKNTRLPSEQSRLFRHTVFDEPALKSLMSLSTPGDPSPTSRLGCQSARRIALRRAAQKSTKTFLTLPSTCWTSLRMTLKRTVLEIGRHWPTVTTSPVLIRKAGEQ